MMKYLLLPTVCLTLMCSSATFAKQASTASIKELLEITKTEELLEYSYKQVEPMISSTIAEIEKAQDEPLTKKQKQALQSYAQKASDIMVTDLSWKKLEPDFIKIYSETFSQEEIDGLIDFYKTPVGQSTIDKMPIVTDKSMQLMQQHMVQVMPKIMQALEETMEEINP